MAIRFLRRKVENPAAELRTVLGGLELPTFPGVVIKTLETLRHPDSSASQVAEALSADPGLTVRLLKLVNSAGFSPARPVSTVDQAVAVVGFGTIESMVLAVGVNRAIPPAPSDAMNQARFWLAGSRRATAARAFAAELHPVNSGLCFTAGLLQDMAVPLLAAARSDYASLLADWNAGGQELHELEAAAYGWTHCQVAEWLCGEWDLPDDLAQAISGHHGYGEFQAPQAVRLTAPFREVEPPEVRDAIVARAAEEAGLGPDRVIQLLDAAESEAIEVAGLFS